MEPQKKVQGNNMIQSHSGTRLGQDLYRMLTGNSYLNSYN